MNEKLKQLLLSPTVKATSLVLLILGVGTIVASYSGIVISIGFEKQRLPVATEVAFTAEVQEQIRIIMMEDLETIIRINDSLSIALNKTIELPLNLNLIVPIDNEFHVQEILTLEFDLPLSFVLSDSIASVEYMEVPFNQSLFINDSLEIDIVVPVNERIKTKMKFFPHVSMPIETNIPIKTKIPISQSLQVNDTILIASDNFKIPISTVLPIKVDVPFDHKMRIIGEIVVPINQNISVPLSMNVKTPVLEEFSASVKVINELPMKITSEMKIAIRDSLVIKLKELNIAAKDIRIDRAD
jgi:hypothetical protein